jgi:formylglycine-generating enzyme required for sulfatase activity
MMMKIKSLDCGVSVRMELTLIQAGTFLMGSPSEEKDRNADETLHEVSITRPFYLGVYAVTQEQYIAVMGVNPSTFKEDVKNPADSVSWESAEDFCRQLSFLRGCIARLPTEAEWEYACRAGTRTPFSCGKTLDAANIRFHLPEEEETNGMVWQQMTRRSGDFPPNAWGLYDMHGNVWEWAADYYGTYPEGPAIDPRGALHGAYRVLRGGSWLNCAKTARSAMRGKTAADTVFSDIGFRVAVEAESL